MDKMLSEREIREMDAFKRFDISGNVTACERYGSGHINDTYLLRADAGKRYILQCINKGIFKDVKALMRNIELVTDWLSAKEPDPRRVLRLVKTRGGESYYEDGAGDFYRVYDFVENSVCLQSPRNERDFYQSAVAFGNFQKMLSDFEAVKLSETIPRFHDTPNRYSHLHEAIRADAVGRLGSVSQQVDFALSREREAGVMVGMIASGELPVRVTHNDTKLNNVLLDEKTGEALCVIDLDTVMPGLAANDFGDSIRFGASTAGEDERDLDKVSMSLDMYKAYCDGFLNSCGELLTKTEKETLPLGAKLMTLECGVRFLTDYLSGDTYYHISRPEHNLDRCKTQFKLVGDMEKKWSQMNGIISGRNYI